MWSDAAVGEDSPDNIRSLGGEGAIAESTLYFNHLFSAQSTLLRQVLLANF